MKSKKKESNEKMTALTVMPKMPVVKGKTPGERINLFPHQLHGAIHSVLAVQITQKKKYGAFLILQSDRRMVAIGFCQFYGSDPRKILRKYVRLDRIFSGKSGELIFARNIFINDFIRTVKNGKYRKSHIMKKFLIGSYCHKSSFISVAACVKYGKRKTLTNRKSKCSFTVLALSGRNALSIIHCVLYFQNPRFWNQDRTSLLFCFQRI